MKSDIQISRDQRQRWSQHAPGHVRDMFREAIEAYVHWNSGEPEPTVEYEFHYEPQQITLSQACGILWNCSDILPRSDFEWLERCGLELKRQTYAAAAQAMLQEIKTPVPIVAFEQFNHPKTALICWELTGIRAMSREDLESLTKEPLSGAKPTPRCHGNRIRLSRSLEVGEQLDLFTGASGKYGS